MLFRNGSRQRADIFRQMHHRETCCRHRSRGRRRRRWLGCCGWGCGRWRLRCRSDCGAIGRRFRARCWRRCAALFAKARRRIVGERRLRMQLARALKQHAFGLEIGGVGDAAIDGAYCRACFMVVEADAFRALRRHDVVNVLRYRGARRAVKFPRNSARINRRVRTFRLACSAVDTFARDRRRHLATEPQFI